jgi:hypothetical protein
VALVCLVLLFIGGPGAYSTRTFAYGWGLGHLICFALWTYLYLLWRQQQSFTRQSLEALLLAVLLGAGTELLQAAVGRQASWLDFGHDLLGCLLALSFSAQLKNTLAARRLWLLRLPILVLVVWTLLPFVRVATDDLIAHQQFPLLSGFETPFEVSRWGGNSKRFLETEKTFSGAGALRVELNTSRYSGTGLKHFPADWSGFRRLQFHVYNPESEPFEFHFRIHDQLHRANGNRYSDRFNTSLLALPGWSGLEIPLAKVAKAPRGREMDMRKIAGMILFVGKLEKPRTIYLDEVRLLP